MPIIINLIKFSFLFCNNIMFYTTVHMRHTSSGSSSSRDAKDVFISGCRNDFDFSQITPEKISKLSKENQNYFHKCDDAINNKLSVDSLVYYSSFILPIICILIFIRIGKKHYRIAEEKIKNAKYLVIFARKPENNPSNSMEIALVIGGVLAALIYILIYIVYIIIVEIKY
ncbi:hypothetical protein G3R47_09440 [Acinetobacter baumannii]|uniref:hypothetical protein n=1 Tax=Acinetobacter baumannii TaxID=470 RepID=UPI001463DD3D|nr:hypothetical protein [Acinetobacter baumannii]MBD0437648.1 hypothetical protein [Acinetobacter baumannii]QJP37717.1 hypothetical protein G3R47_09440 [Acinetobacter baumannii]HAV4527680.1 hypothetical protein [Acinetobacter baumannii]HCW4615560.1 hypothetical protein [Acinetobacter baumannii]HEE5879457.1 hypothetical protein [Acinetobacter baumannii]